MKISMIINIHVKNRWFAFHDDQSCMTSSRRHFVFSRFSHVIDHIFLIKCHFQNSFGSHKVQVHIYHLDVFMTARASRRARTRASKFQNAQNSTLNIFLYVSDDFEHFRHFCAYSFFFAILSAQRVLGVKTPIF